VSSQGEIDVATVIPDGLYRRGGRLVWRFVQTHPGPFVMSIVGAVLFSAAAVAVPLVVGRITDDLLGPAFDGGVSADAVLRALALLVGLGLVRGVSIIIRRYYAAMVEARMQVTLRSSVGEKYLDVPMSYYNENPTGELLAHADADVVGTTNSIRPLPFSIGVVVLVVFALISLFLIDWSFALVAVVLFPALALLNRRYTNRVHRPVTLGQERLGTVSTIAHESFDGALVVKTLGLLEVETDRFAVEAEALRQADVEAGRIRAGFDPVLDALPNLGTLLLFVIGGWRISQGAVTAGDLVQAALLFSILAFPMRVFGYFLQEMPRAVVSIDRIDAVTSTPDAPRVIGGDAVVIPDGPLGLEVSDLSFAYDGESVLEDVAFDVRPGEILAVVGPTGSGKSTLVSLLVRLMEPTAGEVRVGGVPAQRVDPDELRAAVSLVFQESFLFASTLRENVALDDRPDEHVDEAASTAMVTRFVEHLPQGWTTTVGERGVTLSGGQRQRVALARALARRPRVLILDDATSAVDPVIEARILEGLRRRDGMTLVIVAHRLSTIRLADRVVYLEGGRVGGVGTHEALLASVDGYEALVRAYEEDGWTPGDGGDDSNPTGVST
jgi:ABC-type multidrug transport system fused ATPase/permease subunit